MYPKSLLAKLIVVIVVFVVAFPAAATIVPGGVNRAHRNALALFVLHVARVSPVTGTKSTMYLSNHAGVPSDTLITSYDGSGKPLGVFSRRLGADETISFDSTSLPAETASLTFAANGAISGVQVIESADGAKTEAIPFASAISNQLEFPPMASGDMATKKIFVFNTSGQATRLALVLFDAEGVELARTNLAMLAANESRTINVANEFQKRALAAAQLVRLLSESNVVGFQLVESVDGDVVALPAAVHPANNWEIQIQREQELFVIATEPRLFNASDSIVGTEVEAFDDAGSSVGYLMHLAIAPRATVVLSFEGLPPNAKLLRVRAEGAITAYAVFHVSGGKGMAALLGSSESDREQKVALSVAGFGSGLIAYKTDGSGTLQARQKPDVGNPKGDSAFLNQERAVAAATVTTYTIRGRVVRADNANLGVANVLIDTSNRQTSPTNSVSTRTDTNGNFTLQLRSDAAYAGACGSDAQHLVITPVTTGAGGYVFGPSFQKIPVSSRDNVNFTATVKPTGGRPTNQPDFRLPLPLGDTRSAGGYDWTVSVEAGGYFSTGGAPGSDSCHTDLGSGFYAIDIVGPDATPILAAADGDVVTAGYDAGWGNHVVISHPGSYYTLYGHFREFPLVTAGTHVTRGQVIGLMGSTGLSSGVHVHFEIYYGGRTTANSQSTTAALRGIQVQYTPLVNYAATGRNKSTNPGPFTVISPNGGESLRAGAIQTIRWNYLGNSTSVGNTVRIELLKSGSVYSVIASGAPTGTGGSGSYNWTVPTLPAGSDYKIRIVSTTRDFLSDSSDSNFTVIQSAGQPRAVVSTSLRLSPSAGPFYVGQTLGGTVSIANRGNANLIMSKVLIGGRVAGICPNNVCPDFTVYNNITLAPGQVYNYSGSLRLPQSGSYSFFAAYQRPDGSWNTNLDTEPGSVNSVAIAVQQPAIQPTARFTLTGQGRSISQGGAIEFTVGYNGSVPIRFDGSASSSGTGSITQHRWTSNGGLLGYGQVLNLNLGHGTHQIQLEVTNSSGLTATANATVTVYELQLTSSNPVSPVARSGDQDVTVYGQALQTVNRIEFRFPGGGSGNIYAPGQIFQNQFGQLTMRVTLGVRGTYSIRAYTSGGLVSNWMSFTAR